MDNLSKRRIAWVTGIFSGLLVIAAILPTIVSTDWGTKVFLKCIDRKEKITIHAQSISLHWFGPQEIAGIDILDKENGLSFTCEKIYTNAGLWKTLFFHDVRELNIQNGQVDASGNGIDKLARFINPDLSEVILAAVGPSIHLELDGKISPEVFDVALNGRSSQFNLQVQTQTQHGNIALKAPATVSFILSQSLIDTFVARFPSLESVAFVKGSLATLTVDQLFLPRNRYSESSFNSLFSVVLPEERKSLKGIQGRISSQQLTEGVKIVLNADMGTSTVSLNGTIKGIPEKNLQSSLELHARKVPMDILDTILGKQNMLSQLLGPNFDCDLSMIQKSDQMHLRVQGSTPQFHFSQMECDAVLKEQGRLLVVASPFAVHCSLVPAFFEKLLSNSYRAALLAPIGITLNVNSFSLPLSIKTTQQLKLQGDVLIDKMEIGLQAQSKHASLQDISMKFDVDGNSRTISSSLHSQVIGEHSEAGSIDAHASINGIHFETGIDCSEATVTVGANLSKISTSLLELCVGRNQSFSALIGPSLDFKFKAENSPHSHTYSLNAQSDLLDIDADFTVKDNAVQMSGPEGIFNWTLTPEGYSVLDQWMTSQNHSPRSFALNQPSTLKLLVHHVSCPVQNSASWNHIPSLSFDLSRFQIDADMNIDKLSFVEAPSGQAVSLKGLEAHLSKADLQTPIQFSLHNGNVKTGHIHVAGKIAHLFADNGEITPQKAVIRLDANIQQFPLAVIDLGARMFGNVDFPFSSIFGQSLNLSLATEIQNLSGPVHFNLNSPNIKTSLSGKLQNGILTLNEPVYAQALISSKLGRFLLKNADRFPISAVSAKNPITLQIDPSDVTFPIYPFDVSKINIPKVHIELGHVICRNKGNLKLILNLLKAQDKHKEMNVWFAPIDLHVKNGIIDYERTEMLVADTFDVATWGKLDLVKDHANLMLGFTADCLNRAFGIKDLPPNYVLQLKLKGKIGDLKINSSKAATKIATLLAWQYKALPGDTIRGTSSAILGEVLNQLGSLPDKDKDAPVAKHPYPWEIGKEEEVVDEQNFAKKISSKKRAIKKGDKPLKQLLKILR